MAEVKTGKPDAEAVWQELFDDSLCLLLPAF